MRTQEERDEQTLGIAMLVMGFGGCLLLFFLGLALIEALAGR
ncbi:hypothetical protein [Nocardioides caricicola]|uniref:Lipoprotein n=1 Tax=Nocardioides caricicola TaxID=634770 RepID=A0ABW0N087_9ACTN